MCHVNMLGDYLCPPKTPLRINCTSILGEPPLHSCVLFNPLLGIIRIKELLIPYIRRKIIIMHILSTACHMLMLRWWLILSLGHIFGTELYIQRNVAYFIFSIWKCQENNKILIWPFCLTQLRNFSWVKIAF